MEIEQVNIVDIVPYANNPRKNDKAVDIVMKSIQEFGFLVPIILDDKNTIVAGHTRVKAAIQLGMDSVPVIYTEGLTDEQIKAFRIMDNKSNQFAEWDFEKLKDEFYALEDTDSFNFTGFTTQEISEIWDKQTEEDDFDTEKALEEPKYPIKNGDIYQLGTHRLMCGDATKKEHVDTLMGETKADLLLTDPPYGIDIVKDNKKIGYGDGRLESKSSTGSIGASGIVPVGEHRKIIGDNKPFEPKPLLEYGKNQIIWGGNYFATKLYDTSCWIIWDKRGGIPSNNFADCEIAWTSFKKPTRLFTHKWSGLLREGNRKEEMIKRVHPTQKPVGLHCNILKDYSKENEIILDLFGGSGSTLIACEQTKRKCYMMELDEKYCSVIIERWEKLTGKQAIKLN